MRNICVNTFRELIRNRILSMILFFACIFIGFTKILATLSLGQTDRIIIDFGLAMIEICGLIAVVFVGGQILFKEIEGKTIYLILSKPIARKDFIIGKFAGFAGILMFLLTLQAVVLLGLLYWEGIPIDPLVFTAIGAIAVKLLITFAVILFFSTFASPLLSILFTIGIYVASHSVAGMLDMATRLEQKSLVVGAQSLMAFLPQFEALNTAKNTIGTPIGETATYYAINFGIAGLYLVVVLTLAVIIFDRKTFENA